MEEKKVLTINGEKMEQKLFYYLYKSRKDGLWYCIGEPLNPYLMTGDYLLFDSAKECAEYYKNEGIPVDRYV